MSSMKKLTTAQSRRHITGQGMTEYIIVVALIAIGCVGAVSIFGEAVQAQFANMSNSLMGVKGNATVKVEKAKPKTLKDYGS